MSNFVEVKTAELFGPALDWAVARVTGVSYDPASVIKNEYDWAGRIVATTHYGNYSPSIKWVHGGPLIEEHGIEFKWITDATIQAYSYTMSENIAWGVTHLVAACRLIAMELGDVVQVPAGLVRVDS